MNQELHNYYYYDKCRYSGQSSHSTRFLYWLRKAQFTRSKFVLFIARVFISHYRKKYGLEIPYKVKIGKGLYLGHAFNITINPNVVIGCNCNIHKGVVIGQINSGDKKGVPTLGNEVWVGINSAIVGKINIGDDVLIAPNSFVNCNIPSHSIVFGNPCIIKQRENATEGYINNKA